MPSDAPDLARMRAEMLMQDEPVYGNDGMDMFQRDPNMQQIGLFGKKPPKPPPVELADPSRRAFFKLPMQDQLPAVIPSPMAPKPGGLPVVPSQPSPEALMPPTPNVAPPAPAPEQQQPGVLETLAEKALSTPMTRRGFLETTAKSAASQALKPKLDLGLFNESPLTSALTDKETYDSGILASTAADFVKKQLSGPQFDTAVEQLKTLLEDERPEYVEMLENEPQLMFHFYDPYMDELDPELDAQVHKVYRDLFDVDKLATESGIPANVFRAHGINEDAMVTPLHRISNHMRNFYSSLYEEEPHFNAAFDQLSNFLTNEKMDAAVSDAIKTLPNNPTNADINAAALNAYDALRNEFIADTVKFGSSSEHIMYESEFVNDEWVRRLRKEYLEDDQTNNPNANKMLSDALRNVGVSELREPAESVWSHAQEIVGPIHALIKSNIKAKLASQPLRNINDHEYDDYTYYKFDNDDKTLIDYDDDDYED